MAVSLYITIQSLKNDEYRLEVFALPDCTKEDSQVSYWLFILCGTFHLGGAFHLNEIRFIPDLHEKTANLI